MLNYLREKTETMFGQYLFSIYFKLLVWPISYLVTLKGGFNINVLIPLFLFVIFVSGKKKCDNKSPLNKKNNNNNNTHANLMSC